MSGFWLWGHEPFLHWLAVNTVGAVYQFCIFVLILTPTFKWAKGRLSPRSPGGYGDIEGPDGRPLWEWLRDFPPPKPTERKFHE